MADRVIIFDTTLRDGEQTPNVSFHLREKLEIAKELEAMGVDVIEAGFAASSRGDFRAISAVSEQIRNVTVCSLARCVAYIDEDDLVKGVPDRTYTYGGTGYADESGNGGSGLEYMQKLFNRNKK